MYIEIPDGYISVDAIDYIHRVANEVAILYLRGGQQIELRGDIAVQVLSYMRANKVQFMSLYSSLNDDVIDRRIV